MRYALLALALALVLLAGPARATEGTCTVTSSITTTNLNLSFPMPVVNGLVMPVEFDAAGGTFSIQVHRPAAGGEGGAASDKAGAMGSKATVACGELKPLGANP